MKNSINENFVEIKKQLQEKGDLLRKTRLKEVNNKEAALEYVSNVRSWFKKSIGELGQLDSPRSECKGKIETDFYFIEKWLFEVFPGTFTSANVYVPKKVHPAKVGFIAPLGHWPEGKACIDYQNLGSFMAYHGVTVMVYDHAGLGERREFWDTIKEESLPGKTPTSEHCRIGDLMIASGVQPANFFLTEARRALDFFKTFPSVDANKVGISGASGGGSMSREAACYFDDLAFSIPVCILRSPKVGSAACHEQIIWNEGLDGYAHIDNLIGLAPKPVMVVSEFLEDGLAESYQGLRKIYDLMGASSEVTSYFRILDKHGYTHPMIEAVYRFLKTNFKLDEMDLNCWPQIKNLKELELSISSSGFLNRELPQVSMAHHIWQRGVENRKKLTKQALEQCLSVSELVQWDEPSFSFYEEMTVVSSTKPLSQGDLPCIDFEGVKPGWYHGYGNVYKDDEADYGRWFLSFGSSLMAIRVHQLLFYLKHPKGVIKKIKASGKWALPTLCVAALTDLSIQFELFNLIEDYEKVFKEDLNLLSSANYIKGLLPYGDIADIIQLAGDKITIVNRTDSFGRVLFEKPI